MSLRPLDFGEILDGSFTLYRRHFSSFALTALATQAPLVALYLMFAASPPSAASVALLQLPVTLLTSIISLGAMTYMTGRAYTGHPVSTGDGINRGLARFLPLLGAYMIVGILAMLGFFALIVGAFIVLIMAFAVAPAVVLENRGPAEAFSRSRTLASGAWGRVFGITMVAYIIAALPSLAVAGAAFFLGSTSATGEVTATGHLANAVAQVLSALTFPFSVAATVLLYYDRRVRTEALDVQLAAEGLPAGTPAPAYPQY